MNTKKKAKFRRNRTRVLPGVEFVEQRLLMSGWQTQVISTFSSPGSQWGGVPVIDKLGDIFVRSGTTIAELPVGSTQTQVVAQLDAADADTGVQWEYGSLTVDSSGNLFVFRLDPSPYYTFHAMEFVEIPAGTGAPQVIQRFDSTSLAGVGSNTVDQQGDVYGILNMRDVGTQVLFKIAGGATTTTQLPQGFDAGPMTADQNGNLVIFNYTDNTFYMVAAGSNNLTAIGSAARPYIFPGNLTVDGNGNLYFTAVTNNDVAEVMELKEGASQLTPIVQFTQNVNFTSLAVDDAGNIFGTFADSETCSFFEIASGTYAPVTLLESPASSHVGGVTVGDSGAIYYTDIGVDGTTTEIRKLVPTSDANNTGNPNGGDSGNSPSPVEPPPSDPVITPIPVGDPAPIGVILPISNLILFPPVVSAPVAHLPAPLLAGETMASAAGDARSGPQIQGTLFTAAPRKLIVSSAAIRAAQQQSATSVNPLSLVLKDDLRLVTAFE